MKTTTNILSKIFFFLFLAIGWGSGAWAARFTPTFEASYDAAGHWYNITYWTNGNYYVAQGNGQNLTYGSDYMFSADGLWQFIGNQSSFKLVTKSGLYAKWNGTQYIGISNAEEATTFSLIDMVGTNRVDYWGIHRNEASSNQVWNPTGNLIKEYNNDDNNSSVKIIEPVIKLSSEPVGEKWAANTHWYSMYNVRAASNSSGGGYLATDGNWIDDSGNMKMRVSGKPEGKSGQWAFVMTSEGIRIYNRAMGTGYVMGTVNNASDGNSRTKMYEGTGTVANVTKTYSMGSNGDGFWICLTGGNRYLDDGNSGYLTVWNTNNGSPKTSNGNRFILSEANLSVDVTPSFNPTEGETVSSLSVVKVTFTEDVFNVYDATAMGLPEGTPQPLPTLRRVSDNAIVATATGVTSVGDFGAPYAISFSDVISDGDYKLVIPEGTFYTVVDEEWVAVAEMVATYHYVAPPATEGYRIIINGDNNYIVSTTANVKSGNHTAKNNGFLDLAAAPEAKDTRSLSINCTDKFVWGPVINNAEKTITFSVKEPVSNVANLTEGFYQLQLVETAGQDFKTRLGSILKTGTVNAKSNYYYLMPWYSNASYNTSSMVYKYSGVYESGNAPASYVYLKRDGSGNLHFQSINGHYSNRPDVSERSDISIASNKYKIESNKLSIDGWVKEGLWSSNNANGDEGPHEAYDGSGNKYYEFYYAARADISDYKVYKVDFVDWAAGSSLKGDPNATYRGSATCYSLPTVYRNGYFFFPKEYVPTIADFSVAGISYTNPDVLVSKTADANGIYTLTFGEHLSVLDGTVNVLFFNENGEAMTGVEVIYHPSNGGEAEVIASTATTHEFQQEPFADYLAASLFTTEADYNLATSYDEENKTLTFTFSRDPHRIVYSPAPTAEGWAAKTKWFTWRSNRSNLDSKWQLKYLTTTEQGVRDDLTLTIEHVGRNVRPTDRGGMWCFVGDESGFYIQNAAYGPDYVFAYVSNKYTMVHKDEAPAGAVVKFRVGTNVINQDNISYVYGFLHGTTGNTCIHVDNNDIVTSTYGTGDTGKSFTLTAVTNAELAVFPEYDVYTVARKGAPNDFDISYKTTANVFGKRGHAYNGDPIILVKGSSVTKDDFVNASSDYTLEVVTVKNQPGHNCKLLELRLRDVLATDEYRIVVNKPDAHYNKDYKVTFNGDEYNPGSSIFYRPDNVPEAIDFDITGADDYFVWGPVINKTNKTITYEVRERTKTIQPGLYAFQLKSQDVIDAINAYVKPKEGNINIRAHQQYLAPTVFSVGNATMKFTGVPDSRIGDESTVYVYVYPAGDNQVAILSLEGYYARSVAFNANGNQTHDAVPIRYTLDADGYLHIPGWGTAQHPMEGPLQQGGQNGQEMTFAMYMPEQSQDLFDVYQVEFAGQHTSTQTIRYNGEGRKAYGIASNGGFFLVAKGTPVPTVETLTVTKGTGRITNVELGGTAQDGQARILRVTLEQAPEKWQFNIAGANPNNVKIVYGGQEYESGTLVELPHGTVVHPEDIKTTSEGFVHGPLITTAIDQNDVNTVTFQLRQSTTAITPNKWYAIQLRDKEVTYFDGSTRTGSLVAAVNGMRTTHKGSYIYMGGNLSHNYVAGNAALELSGVTEDVTDALLYVEEVQKDGDNLKLCIMLQNGMYLKNDGTASATKPAVSDYITAHITADGTIIWDNKVMPWKNPNNLGMQSGIGYTSSNTRNDDIEMYFSEGQVLAFQVEVRSAADHSQVLNDVQIIYQGKGHIYGDKRTTHGQFRFAEMSIPIELDATGHPDKSKFVAKGKIIESIDLTMPDDSYARLVFYIKDYEGSNMIIHQQGSFFDDLDNETHLPGTGFIQRGDGLINYVGYNGTEKLVHTVQNTALYEIPLYLKQGDAAFTSYEPQGTDDTGGDNARKYQRWYNYDLDGLEASGATTTLTDIVTNLPTSNANYKKANGYLTGNSYGGQFLSPQFKLPTGVEKYNVGLDVSFGTLTASGSNFLEPTLNMRVVYHVMDAKIIAQAIKDATTAGKFYEVHDIMMPNIKKGSTDDHTGADVLPLDMDLNNYWMFFTDEETKEVVLGKVGENSAGVHLVVEIGENTAGIINAKMIPNGNNALGGISYASFNTGHFVCFQYPGTGTLRQVPANSKATINVYIQNGSDTAGRQKLAQFNLTFLANSEPLIVPEAMASSRSDDEMAKKYTLGAQMTFENVHVDATAGGNQRYKYPLDFANSGYGYRGHPWAARSEYNITKYNGMSGPGNYQYTFYPIQAYQNNCADPSNTTRLISGTDHLLYIDAADQAGKIFNVDLDAQLCVGSRLFCYGWVGCTVGNYSGQHPASVLINVIGYDSDDNEHVVASFNPGMISARGYDSNGDVVYSLIHGRYPAYERYVKDADTYYAVWSQIGFNFLIDDKKAAGIVRYAFQIVNNSYNSNGGDIVLDNFKIYYSTTSANIDHTTPLCADETRHVRIQADYDGLIARGNINETAEQSVPVTYCFLDVDAFDHYTARMLKDHPLSAHDSKYFDEDDIEDLDKPLIEYFDIDEATGTHKLNKKYENNNTVRWMLEFSFGEALVGAPVVNNQGGVSQKDHGIHSTTFKVPFEENEIYRYKHSVDDRVYREETDEGTRLIVMKQPIIRHTDALVAEYQRAGLPIEDHTRDADGNITEINPHYGKIKANVAGVEYYYTPRMQAGKQYYLVFVQKSLDNTALNSTYVGEVATTFFNIQAPCTPILKFKNPDPMHVITEVDRFYVTDPIANVCVNGKTQFNYNLHDAKVELQKNPEYNKMDAHGTPGTDSYHVHTIDDNVLNYVYDWWLGSDAPFAAPYGIGTLEDYDAAVSDTYTYSYGADELNDPLKPAGEAVNLKQAIADFRFYYPEFNKHQAMSEQIRIPTDEEWAALKPNPYNDLTGYSLQQCEIDAIRECVNNGTIVLYKQALTLPIDASKYTPESDGTKVRYVSAHPIIPQQEYTIDETLIYCPEPRDVKLLLIEKSVEMYNGFAGMPYPEDMKDVPIRIGLSQINGAKAKHLRVPVRNLKFAAGIRVENFLRPQGITAAKPNGNPIFLSATNDPNVEDVYLNAAIAEVVGSATHSDDEEQHYIDIRFNNGVKLREGYYYTLTLPFEEDATFPGADCPCKNEMNFTLKVVPEYQVWTGAAGNTDWTNDQNWARADRSDLHADGGDASVQVVLDGATDIRNAALYPSNADNTTNGSYVPMFFTNVLFKDASVAAPVLYKPETWKEASLTDLHFLTGLNETGAKATSTALIKYDMEVNPTNSDGSYDCGLFGTYVAKGVTFEPATSLYNAHLLYYKKAWVEYALNANRWYTIASPLQETYSGEWYSPTGSGAGKGKQLTPHFYGINYDVALNNRFNPAYYQRSWDKGTANMFRCFDESHNPDNFYLPGVKPLNVAIGLDWSHVYNDVEVGYSNGGFSVKPAFGDDSDGEVLVRMPKGDASYLYFDEGDETDDATHRGDETAITRGAGHYRLITDKLATAESFTQTLTNANGAANPYYLVANPFMAPMDMDEFFTANPQFEAGKFWIMSNSLQEVSMKTADGWISTTGANAVGAVAPLQAFFVKLATPTKEAVTVTYNAAMQKALAADATVPVLKAPAKSSRACPKPVEGSSLVFHIEATNADGALQSQAAVTFSETADNAFRAGEDAELLLDGNTAEEVATVFTAAPTTETDEAQAMQFNALSRTVTTIPLGVIAPTDETETTLTFTGITALTDVMEEASYLYDAANGSFTALDEETTLTVTGTSSGRYFIVSGMHIPYDNADDNDNGEALDTYNLHGIRVAMPQRGNVTIRGSRKEFRR